MSKTTVSTQKAPAAIGPYSQAVKLGDFVFTSGQIPIDPASGDIVPGGVEAQARQALHNLEEVLKAAGASSATVLKTTLFIKNMDDFAHVNDVYAGFFKSEPPARSCVEVARLPKDVLVEIEAIAFIPRS
ncbi:RidA family protein [Pelotomaculum propionicicum]|uniref:RutC family protein n=1 Tax=Pelotomaculum propionicicum TaxID=258475 RepID=A0A4Y7RQH0_9FIRM|nr:RidA family protein [Pelotomaculum propionicicum]NLI13241.1 RidA family protein [Peptococcaceae bacterium]TEB10507.1 RutC family protein [Pelotomaculum propionicicum]